MAALAFIPLVGFWAVLVVAFRRPGHNYVGHPPTAFELIGRALLPIFENTAAAFRAIGEAFKLALEPVRVFVAALERVPRGAWNIDREWEEFEP